VTLGWKYNMDNIQAAILMPQLDRIDADWRSREALATRYEERLANLAGLELPETRPGVRHSRHLFTVWIKHGRRDVVLKRLRERGIGAMVNYDAIHTHTLFRDRLGTRPGDFPNAELVGRETISLPLHARLEMESVDEVAETLRLILAETD
jgi:dTDP-4-amino-4,6-dideoxygalactose transaminase